MHVLYCVHLFYMGGGGGGCHFGHISKESLCITEVNWVDEAKAIKTYVRHA